MASTLRKPPIMPFPNTSRQTTMPSRRSFAAAIFLLCSLISCSAQSFDYVVVGAGTCGLTVANRLSENPNVTVAIIDPGNDERANPNVTDPAIWSNNYGTHVDWAYPSLPQAGGENRTFACHAGKGIGGTSLINGMTYIRGDKAQFDAWERLGNPGWNWDTMFAQYKKLEALTPPSQWQMQAGASIDPQYHGTDGPIHVGFTSSLMNGTLEPTVSKTWGNLSFPIDRDVNGGSTFGFDVWPQTIDQDSNIRWDAATAFYWPVEGRKNLKLIKGTAVKAIWSKHRESHGLPMASGVEYLDASNRSCVLNVRKEVIVSAGALRSPVFLELSGIGNPNLLSQHGIPVAVDLPAVGENLQEQPNTVMYYTNTINVTGYAPYALFAKAQDLFGANTSEIAIRTNESISSWAKAVAEASNGALNASALEIIYRIQHDLIFNKNVTIAEILPTGAGQNLITAAIALLPFSRGSVHLASPQAIDCPQIDPKFLFIDHDLDVNIALNKLCRRYFETQPIRSLITAQVVPNTTVLPDNATNEQWASFVRGSFGPNSHPIGTAAMMARELGGVVDPQLKIYGIRNIRVVDASVLPTQFSGHLTATLYAVADRAADTIKSEW